MFKTISKLAAILIFILLIGGSSVLASGKMEVKIGQRVDLIGESTNPRAEYKWVVKRGDEIVSTQSGRNFSFNFPYQGEYIINLTATDGPEVESTTIHVLSGERYSRPFMEEEMLPEVPSLYLVLETLPYRSPEGRITLFGDDGKVYFYLAESLGEILEYRIDKNIFEDSDGNGVANDDIDNVNDDSYLTGQFWQAAYKRGEEPKIVAEITLADKSGEKDKEQVEIVFGDRVDTGPPIATLDSLPMPHPEDGLIHLYEDPHKVAFYARRSEGKILEYRIDKNIFVDSDGDGSPSNDIDNLNDISFKTGDVWETEYDKTEEQIIAQLIVVGEEGMGSRIQKGIVFGERPIPVIPSLEAIEEGIRLTADKDFVVKGDPITFEVKGLELAMESYSFEWDFDGDGEVDKEIEGDNSATHIYETAGVFEINVKITDKEGNEAERTLEIISKETVTTKADFSFEVDINTVTFTDLSTVNLSLADKTLDYAWSFGDTDPEGYEEQKDQIGLSNPSYTYRKAGKYLVTLTVTDADQVTDSKSAEIEILQDFVPLEEGVVEEPVEKEAKEKGPLFWRILKIFLYVILIVIILVLVIVGGFLIFFKVQHPDLTFEELVDEFKAKILTIIGAPEMAEAPKAKAPPEAPAEAPPAEEAPPEEAEVPEEEKPEEAPPEEEAGPTPPWMKEKEVIEGEVEEEVPPPEAPPEEVPAPPEAPAEAPPAEEAPPEEVAPEPEVPTEEVLEEEPREEEIEEAPPEEEEAPPEEEEEEKKPPEGGEPAEGEEGEEGEEGPVPDWLKGV